MCAQSTLHSMDSYGKKILTAWLTEMETCILNIRIGGEIVYFECLHSLDTALRNFWNTKMGNTEYAIATYHANIFYKH